MNCVGFQRLARRTLRASAACLAVLLPIGGVHAQAPVAPAAAAPEPSTNAMVNLIRLLVKQGTITQANGDALLAQAESDAQAARSTITQAAANAGVAPPPDGTVRVPYVPVGVRKQIAEQVRSEVMAQAKAEGWAAPGNAAPDWTRKIRISGDVRVRSQSELYSRANSTDILDIAQMAGTNAPINVTDLQNLPVLNTTQDRPNRMRIRARLHVDADISPKVKAGLSLATGDDNGPISTNAALAGGLRKRDIWLDRAFVQLQPVEWAKIDLGRFANPFRSTDLLFDEDLHFDGVAAEVRADKWLPEGFSLALRGGAFPLDNGSPNYPDTSVTKEKFPSKWLFSGQIQAGYETRGGLKWTGAVAYHDFRNVQGQLSAPCDFNGVNEVVLPGGADPAECSTDGTRVMNPRKGNTLFWIRNLAVNSTVPGDRVLAERQYLGLVQPFRILDINGSLTVPLDDEVKATLTGDFLINLGYKRSNACRYGDGTNGAVTQPPGIPFNNVVGTASRNFNPCSATDRAQLVSGNKGWLLDLAIGHANPRRWGEWRVSAGYRYLQSDAVMDSFTDSDFHLGGTNAKGYTVTGFMGLFDGVSMGARWLSSNEIRGEPLSIDVFQLDLQAQF